MRWSDKSKGMDALGSWPGSKPVATRHERAVGQSCRLAQEAADIGDFGGALAWLKAVEMVDGPLAPEWDAKRALWLRQGRNGTSRTDGRFEPRRGVAADARQEGRP